MNETLKNCLYVKVVGADFARLQKIIESYEKTRKASREYKQNVNGSKSQSFRVLPTIHIEDVSSKIQELERFKDHTLHLHDSDDEEMNPKVVGLPPLPQKQFIPSPIKRLIEL